MAEHYADTVGDFFDLLIGTLIVEVVLAACFRYLQTSTGAAIDEEDMELATRGFLWTIAKKAEAPPGDEKKPPPPEKETAETAKATGKTSPTKPAPGKSAGATCV